MSLKGTQKKREKGGLRFAAGYPKDPLLFGDLIEVCHQEGAVRIHHSCVCMWIFVHLINTKRLSFVVPLGWTGSVMW